MEQAGDDDLNANVDITGCVDNEYRSSENIDGDENTDIDVIEDPEGPPAVPLMLDKIANNSFGTRTTLVLLEEKKKKPRKKRKKCNKKPPDAPKRFKSSFIFFSMAKHKEIKESLARDGGTKFPNITSMVSEAWRTLDPLKREKFEEMARQDKARYDIEKRNYVPPPGTSLTSKRKRDPDAPKRPMSAYLSYANKLRGKVKSENPDCSNGEISKILSNMWKGMSDDKRKEYKDNEQMLWDIYREKMIVWKKNNDGRKKGAKMTAELISQNLCKKSKNKDNVKLASIDFSNVASENDGGVDEHFLGLANVPGIDTNPNTDEMLAASALRGVRGGPHQHLGAGSGDQSNSNGFGGIFRVNSTSGIHSMLNGAPTTGQTGFGQMEVPGFPYNHYGYPLAGNTHAMIMAQIRGAPHQQYSSFLPLDQQGNLSQLASLAGVQNDATTQQQQQDAQRPQQHQEQQLRQSIDQSSTDAAISIDMGNENLGNVVLNENSGGTDPPF